MPSSKRKRKAGNGGDKETTAVESNVNPFLSEMDDSMDIDNENNDDSMFQEVINFMEFSKQLQKTKDQSYQGKLCSSVDKLLSYLVAESTTSKIELSQGDNNNNSTIDDKECRPNGNTSTRHGLISIDEIATLLLPWATKNLLRFAPHENHNDEKVTSDQTNLSMEWKTLEACLSNHASNKDSTSAVDIGSVVTQSILNKLVPLALQISLQEYENTKYEATTTKTAGNCFCLMVDMLYRPTFDLICDSLIPIIRTGIVNIDDFDHGHQPSNKLRTLVSTMRLLRTMQGKANPKKAFLVLSRPDVLLALSEINSKIDSLAFSDNVDALQSREVIRQILFDGLFSHIHHLDGFRSIKITIPIYDKSPLQSAEKMNNTPDTNNVTADDVNDSRKSPLTDHQDNKFRCYQENLFDTIDSQLSANKPTVEKNSLLATIKVIPLLLQGYILESVTSMNLKHRRKKGSKNYHKDRPRTVFRQPQRRPV